MLLKETIERLKAGKQMHRAAWPIEEGYLSGDGANLLLTIQNSDLDKALEIKTQVTDAIDKKFEENYIAGEVLAQTTTTRSNIPDDVKELTIKIKKEYTFSIV